MLLLKGERRKSVVCDAILKGNKNAVCYQYTRDVVPTLNSYIVSSDNPQELLGEKLLNEGAAVASVAAQVISCGIIIVFYTLHNDFCNIYK